MGGIQSRDLFLGLMSLFLALVEDHGTVLRSDVVALAVERRGIVDDKKYIEQIFIPDLLRIKGDANYFDVAGGAGAYVTIRGIRGRSPHVPGFDAGHTLELIEDSFQAPKTSSTKNRRLHVRHICSMLKAGKS